MDNVEYLEKISNSDILNKIKYLAQTYSKGNLLKIKFYLQELLEREEIA